MNYINSVKYNFLLRSSNDGWLGVFLFLSHCLAGESSHHSITAHTFQSSEKRSQLSIRYLILTSLSSHFCNISANGRGDEDKITSLQRLWLCLTKTDILSMLCRHRTVTMFLRKWPCMHWAASSLPPPDLPSILTLHFTKTTRHSNKREYEDLVVMLFSAQPAYLPEFIREYICNIVILMLIMLIADCEASQAARLWACGGQCYISWLDIDSLDSSDFFLLTFPM